MAKRVFLFLAVNVLVVATLSIIVSLLGLTGYLKAYGIDYSSLAALCLVWGMGGSFISLLLSKVFAKMAMGVKTIDSRAPGRLAEVYGTVRKLAAQSGLPMPEVGVYESPEMNAFATGPTKQSSLVAVSSGLLERMSRDEVEGVLAHEMSHIANGDMVTMTLLAGVVNAFSMFLSRIISFFASKLVAERAEAAVRMILTLVLDIVFSILGSIVVAAFSRAREFRADAGAARLSGREKMIAALESLQRQYQPLDKRGPSLATFKISGKGRMSLFATHPSLEARIEALKRL